MRAFKYVCGHMEEIPIEERSLPDDVTSVMLEVVLDDQRQVRMDVSSDGRVWIRAWGTTPARLGNAPQADIRFIVSPQEPNHDEHGYPLPSLKES